MTPPKRGDRHTRFWLPESQSLVARFNGEIYQSLVLRLVIGALTCSPEMSSL